MNHSDLPNVTAHSSAKMYHRFSMEETFSLVLLIAGTMNNNYFCVQHILHIAKKCPQSVPRYQEKNGKAFFSIHQKLRELYEEECSKDSHQPNKVNVIKLLDRNLQQFALYVCVCTCVCGRMCVYEFMHMLHLQCIHIQVTAICLINRLHY
jgi:hypothetical protein